VPRGTAFGELAWKEQNGRFGAALEAVANTRVYVEDSNTEKAAPGYGVLNVRVSAQQRSGGWTFRQFARLNNLLDKTYVGSVIVGDASKRYYEGAPGRTWQAGVTAQYSF
jgi:iron complex outermembrane receptor protein